MRAPSSCSITAATPSTPRRRPPTCCQLGQEPRVLARRDGLDLVAQGGERTASDAPEHLAVAPLRAGPVRQELALDHAALAREPPERGGGDDLADAEPLGHGVRA